MCERLRPPLTSSRLQPRRTILRLLRSSQALGAPSFLVLFKVLHQFKWYLWMHSILVAHHLSELHLCSWAPKCSAPRNMCATFVCVFTFPKAHKELHFVSKHKYFLFVHTHWMSTPTGQMWNKLNSPSPAAGLKSPPLPQSAFSPAIPGAKHLIFLGRQGSIQA